MLIYNRHLLQEALYSNNTLSCFFCFTTAKRTFISVPYEKIDNRAPTVAPQPFRSAFICFLCALLGSFRSDLVAMCYFKDLISISLTPSIQSVIVLFSMCSLFPMTVCTRISYNKGCYRRTQYILGWVIIPSIQISCI